MQTRRKSPEIPRQRPLVQSIGSRLHRIIKVQRTLATTAPDVSNLKRDSPEIPRQRPLVQSIGSRLHRIIKVQRTLATTAPDVSNLKRD
ncbi:hypothetical protein HPB47_001097, partial [Ixodes persulcatus]